MSATDMAKKIEELTEALVFVEPSDMPGLADLHDRFEQVARCCQEMGQAQMGATATESAALIERIILEEVGDPIAALAALGEVVTSMQMVVRDGRPATDVDWANVLRRTTFPAPAETVGNYDHEAATPAAVAPSETPPPPAGGGAPSRPVESVGVADSGRAAEVPAKGKPLEGDLDLLGDFVQEANEHLDAADIHLLTLETDPQNSDALNAVFRGFHTIKGVAGFLGLDDVLTLAHEAENLLDHARKGDVTLSGIPMDVTFEAVDMLKGMVNDVKTALETGGMLFAVPGMPALLTRIETARQGGSRPVPNEVPQRLGEALVSAGATTREAVDHALELQHQPPEHKRIGTILIEQNIASSAIVNEAVEVQAHRPGSGKIGEIMVEMGTVRQDDVAEALRKQEEAPRPPKLGEVLVRSGDAKASDVATQLRRQAAQGATAVQVKEAVKVDATRLDLLVDAIGELVIAESMVSQSPELVGTASPDLLRHLNELDKITRELQEMGTSLRMVPIRPTFQKMARLVRDLAKKSNKEVTFVALGEDTELDKSVVDKIGDPLIHMVRNAVDHGLEASEAERRKAGKDPAGRVELRAFHKGGNIYIEVQDDGRGLDREAILAKAEERGLVRADASLSDREVWNLIFEAGFSTAKQITDVSGRGVGMDVVRRNIESLRGQVEIRSEKNKGSTFSIRLPLTLAIIDGMVVRVGQERYIIPTLSIVTSLRPDAKALSTVVNRGEMLMLQGELIPVIRLGRLFNTDHPHGDLTEAIITVVETDGRRTGLVVDEILGQQQTVIKSLGESMRGLSGIAGGAIMADGRVGLILDVGGLVKLASEVQAT
ncbi:MAG TPA: chemotaxis protein CheA [Candidatus Hydrogenedentes bacterium]|nr:chemotaxis protein CheA [Candidatus Hydrogenedentota bacterium]HPG67208.1 chemotaxis protein CheA [Candidatus Hydrogenedentota bacterium]